MYDEYLKYPYYIALLTTISIKQCSFSSIILVLPTTQTLDSQHLMYKVPQLSLFLWFFFTLFDAARRRMKMDDDEVLIEFFLCFWFSIDLECVHKNLCNCSPVSQTTHQKSAIILKCWADDLSQAIPNV